MLANSRGVEDGLWTLLVYALAGTGGLVGLLIAGTWPGIDPEFIDSLGELLYGCAAVIAALTGGYVVRRNGIGRERRGQETGEGAD